ncbi:MAG TPA: lipopolysaccharide heptosyltransferase I [Terriglobales bacterium]|nr:lipopolysaccharide heptosyltransferase I [Terriglobales bacterium]
MKILIVRLSAMGDVIHAMPAVAGLRREFPDSRIDWAIEERWSPLLTARRVPDSVSCHALSAEQPLANLVHRVHMRSWRKSPFSTRTRSEIRALRAKLHEIEYDHVIDLQGAIRSALLAKASGAKVRAGARDPREFPARWWYNVKAHTPARHVVDQAAEIISRALDRRIAPEAPPFPRATEPESWTDKLLGDDSTQFALINPGAGWGAKCWPAERYSALVRKLSAYGVRCLINAGPGELDLAEQVRRDNQDLSRVVESTLLQLIALTRRAALFVGGDTGPLHLASALNIPVVAIFGPTDPARNGPYGGRYVVLRSPESKRDHTRHREPEPGLLNITVDQVTEAALSLLRVPA